MKTLSRFSASIALLITATACTSSQEVKDQKQAQAELFAIKSNIKKGMTLEELRALSPHIGNCTGSATGTQRCEGIYLNSVARTIGISNSNTYQPAATNKSTRMTFDFEKGKLIRWEEKKDLESAPAPYSK
jgi:hypothetical protein